MIFRSSDSLSKNSLADDIAVIDLKQLQSQIDIIQLDIRKLDSNLQRGLQGFQNKLNAQETRYNQTIKKFEQVIDGVTAMFINLTRNTGSKP